MLHPMWFSLAWRMWLGACHYQHRKMIGGKILSGIDEWMKGMRWTQLTRNKTPRITFMKPTAQCTSTMPTASVMEPTGTLQLWSTNSTHMPYLCYVLPLLVTPRFFLVVFPWIISMLLFWGACSLYMEKTWTLSSQNNGTLWMHLILMLKPVEA